MPESARDTFAFMICDLCEDLLSYEPGLGICDTGTMAFQVADLHAAALAETAAKVERLLSTLNKLVASFEGDALPFTDEQEQAYEEAARLLDELSRPEQTDA